MQHGMLYGCTSNWIKPLHKGGDVNNVKHLSNHHGQLVKAKLFGCIMESEIS